MQHYAQVEQKYLCVNGDQTVPLAKIITTIRVIFHARISLNSGSLIREHYLFIYLLKLHYSERGMHYY